jgi:hypothetical protein
MTLCNLSSDLCSYLSNLHLLVTIVLHLPFVMKPLSPTPTSPGLLPIPPKLAHVPLIGGMTQTTKIFITSLGMPFLTIIILIPSLKFSIISSATRKPSSFHRGDMSCVLPIPQNLMVHHLPLLVISISIFYVSQTSTLYDVLG